MQNVYITRDGKQIQLTVDEIKAAWAAWDTELREEQLEIYKEEVKQTLLKLSKDKDELEYKMAAGNADIVDEIARDIVQDVFVKLWTDDILVKKSLNSLLFTMIRNGCLQHLEKQKVRNKYTESAKLSLQEEELQFYMQEKTSLIEQELENKLNEVLNSLPDRCRQIFVMSRFENKRNKEIAKELDITVKAVEKQITKALSTIRTEMKDYLPLLLFLSGHLFKNPADSRRTGDCPSTRAWRRSASAVSL